MKTLHQRWHKLLNLGIIEPGLAFHTVPYGNLECRIHCIARHIVQKLPHLIPPVARTAHAMRIASARLLAGRVISNETYLYTIILLVVKVQVFMPHPHRIPVVLARNKPHLLSGKTRCATFTEIVEHCCGCALTFPLSQPPH